MRNEFLLLAMLSLLFAVGASPQNPPHVCVRHLVVPTRYPAIARLARLQGTVVAKLTIATDGAVTEAVVETQDPSLVAHPILQSKTEEFVRKWTFECQSCAPGASFEHVIKFKYSLEGNDAEYDDTKVTFDLPDEVTILARPPACDHCPAAKKNKR
jgi:TonB family protein